MLKSVFQNPNKEFFYRFLPFWTNLYYFWNFFSFFRFYLRLPNSEFRFVRPKSQKRYRLSDRDAIHYADAKIPGKRKKEGEKGRKTASASDSLLILF